MARFLLQRIAAFIPTLIGVSTDENRGRVGGGGIIRRPAVPPATPTNTNSVGTATSHFSGRNHPGAPRLSGEKNLFPNGLGERCWLIVVT